MKVSCPACGAEMTLDVLMAHEGAREAVLTALSLPAPLGKLLIQYLGMFRPGKRQLSWERVAAVLGELRDPIAAAQIERHGRAWPAPLEYWKAGLEHMVQLRDAGKLSLPLKSHGYLLEVILGFAEKTEAKSEHARESARAGRSAGGSPTHAPVPRSDPAPRTPIPDSIREHYLKPKQ